MPKLGHANLSTRQPLHHTQSHGHRKLTSVQSTPSASKKRSQRSREPTSTNDDPHPTAKALTTSLNSSPPVPHAEYPHLVYRSPPSNSHHLRRHHDLPKFSHHFQKVISPPAAAGYHVLAPDHRGAGYSSAPPSSYTKKPISTVFSQLVTEHLGVKDNVHFLGHNLCGLATHASYAPYPNAVSSVIWGEYPALSTTKRNTAALSGTSTAR